jgi:hypothetical protein
MGARQARSSGGRGTGLPAKDADGGQVDFGGQFPRGAEKKLLVKGNAAAFQGGDGRIDLDPVLVAHRLAIAAMGLHHGQMHFPGHQLRIAKPLFPQQGLPGHLKEMVIVAVVNGLAHINFIEGHLPAKAVAGRPGRSCSWELGANMQLLVVSCHESGGLCPPPSWAIQADPGVWVTQGREKGKTRSAQPPRRGGRRWP